MWSQKNVAPKICWSRKKCGPEKNVKVWSKKQFWWRKKSSQESQNDRQKTGLNTPGTVDPRWLLKFNMAVRWSLKTVWAMSKEGL